MTDKKTVFVRVTHLMSGKVINSSHQQITDEGRDDLIEFLKKMSDMTYLSLETPTGEVIIPASVLTGSVIQVINV